MLVLAPVKWERNRVHSCAKNRRQEVFVAAIRLLDTVKLPRVTIERIGK